MSRLNSDLRQMENAIGLIIDGVMRRSEGEGMNVPLADVHGIIATLIRVASDWAEVALGDDACPGETRTLIQRHGLEP